MGKLRQIGRDTPSTFYTIHIKWLLPILFHLANPSCSSIVSLLRVVAKWNQLFAGDVKRLLFRLTLIHFQEASGNKTKTIHRTGKIICKGKLCCIPILSPNHYHRPIVSKLWWGWFSVHESLQSDTRGGGCMFYLYQKLLVSKNKYKIHTQLISVATYVCQKF